MVTLIFPVVPLPTIAVILVGEFTTKDAADVPPKLTEVAPFKLIPVISTLINFFKIIHTFRFSALVYY